MYTNGYMHHAFVQILPLCYVFMYVFHVHSFRINVFKPMAICTEDIFPILLCLRYCTAWLISLDLCLA